MELHQLRYFQAVASYRSFTWAAEHERISQASLSQQIHKLEDELGARLFDRMGRRIRLTAFGESAGATLPNHRHGARQRKISDTRGEGFH